MSVLVADGAYKTKKYHEQSLVSRLLIFELACSPTCQTFHWITIGSD
jgi:hypothetical protein